MTLMIAKVEGVWGMTDWAEEIERLTHSLSVTEKDGWILVESERARQIAQALRDLVTKCIELEVKLEEVQWGT